MISYKKIVTRVFLFGEVAFFLANFLYSNNGLSTILALNSENKVLDQENQKLRILLKNMEEDLLEWNRFPFYKEKVAREQLQMVRKDEVIYYNV